MMTEFKISINAYLQDLVVSPVKSLADIIAFNENPDLENITEYNQSTFVASQLTNGFLEKERIEKIDKLLTNGFQKMMEDKLDAMMTPGSRASAVLAIGGYPAITVPAGYDTNGMPFGICFGGLEGTEPKMIEIAYAFEQATRVRMPPPHLLSKISLSDE